MPEIQRPQPLDLLNAAGERDVLSPESVTALQNIDVLKQIEVGLKGSDTVTRPGRMMLVTLVPDDSISIWLDSENVQYPTTDKSDAIIMGHNELLRGMEVGPQGNRSMLHTRYLNGKVLNPFLRLALCGGMDYHVYQPSPNGTPLFTETLVTLGVVLAKTEELVRHGVNVTSATLIMTDGEATDDTLWGRQMLSAVIRDMQKSDTHIIAGMGIGPKESEFRSTFEAMGISEDMVFLATDINAILEAFRMFGKMLQELSAGSSSNVSRPRSFNL